MSSPPFQANNGNNKEDQPLKVTPLLRAKDIAVAPSNTWHAPDLQEEAVRASREAFEHAIKSARIEVAQDLERMRQATLSQARAEGLKSGTEKGTQDGYKKGYETGYEIGYNEAKAVLEAEYNSKTKAFEAERDHLIKALTEEWQTLVLSLTQSLSQLDTPLLQDIVWLCGQMAQRLIIGELSIAPERVNSLVRAVVEGLPHIVYPLVIRLHPDDIALIDILSIAQEGRVDLQADAALERGECVIRSGHSEVALHWQEQARKVMDAALQALLASERAVLDV